MGTVYDTAAEVTVDYAQAEGWRETKVVAALSALQCLQSIPTIALDNLREALIYDAAALSSDDGEQLMALADLIEDLSLINAPPIRVFNPGPDAEFQIIGRPEKYKSTEDGAVLKIIPPRNP